MKDIGGKSSAREMGTLGYSQVPEEIQPLSKQMHEIEERYTSMCHSYNTVNGLIKIRDSWGMSHSLWPRHSFTYY